MANRPLITRRDISTGAVSFQKRKFGRPLGKAREARIHFAFTTADVPVSMPHFLGKRPSTYTVVGRGVSTGDAEPGIYTPDPVYWATVNVVALVSDVSGSWAEVIVRE